MRDEEERKEKYNQLMMHDNIYPTIHIIH